MTAATSMTIKELLELAALDAFGLLDEYEGALYTESFHHAPATVQDDIKRLQAQIASDESLLPIDEPDPALRDRVLAAVAKAIEADSSKLAPLATIGRPRRTAPETAQRVLSASGQFWRAASFVLAGTLLATAYLWSDSYRASQQIATLALIASPWIIRGTASATTASAPALIENSLRDVVLEVEGMTCVSCNITVSKALTNLDGVEEAQVTFEPPKAVVTYDPSRVSIEQMVEATTNVGYPSKRKPESPE